MWDAVVSWNRWAVSWAGNGVPTATWRYPQLLPINLSLTYVFIGTTEVQLFAKAAAAVFPVASLLLLGDLAVRRRSAGYLVALVALGVFNFLTLEWLLVEGYADLPVAFMVLASIYLLELAQESKVRRERAIWTGLAVAIAVGAALTKQGGLLWALGFPIMAALNWRDIDCADGPGRPEAWKVASVCAGIILMAAAPWYVFKQVQFQNGTDQTEQVYVEQANGGRTFGQRAKHVHAKLVEATSNVAVNLLLPLALLGAVAVRRWRRPAILYAVPYAALCVGLTSYDLRNLSPLWPVLFTAGGAGWAEWLGPKRFTACLPRLPGPWSAVLGAVVALVLATEMLGENVKEGRLRWVQMVHQRKLGGERLSSELYAYVERNGLKGRILTNFQLLHFMPDMASAYHYDDLLHPETVQQSIEDISIRYLLVPVKAGILFEASIRKDIDSRLEQGTLRLIFEADGHQFIEKAQAAVP